MFETAIIHYNQYFTNFNPPLPKITTLYGELQDTYERLCAIRCASQNGDGYMYFLCGVRSDRVFHITNDGESIFYNVNSWMNEVLQGKESSGIKYSEVSVEQVSPFPEAQTSNLNSVSGLIISGSSFRQSDEPYRSIVDCNIPIFTVTLNDYTALNNYITTGNYSGADNYKDLYPDYYKDIINSDRSQKTIRLEFPDGEREDIEANQIYMESLSIEESLYEGENIEFGKCNGGIFKIRVADITSNIDNARMNVYCHYANDELGEYDLEMGKYIIQTTERTSDRRWRDITATDYMTLFDVDIANWYNTTLFPTEETTNTVKEIRESLCTFLNIEYEDTTLVNDLLVVGKSISPESLSARELMEACCEVNGCFGHFGWDGELKFITIEFEGLFPSETLFPSDNLFPREANSDGKAGENITTFKKSEYDDYDVKDIDSVAILKEDGTLAVTSGATNYTNRYVVSSNILLYGHSTETLRTVASNILSKIGDTSYRPNETEMFGGVYMTLGQPYSVNARVIVGNEYVTNTFMSYLLKRSINGIIGMSQKLEAKGEQTQPQTQTTDIVKEIRVLQGKSASYKRDLDSLESEYTDFATETTSKIEQMSNKIVLQVDNNNHVVAIELNVDDPEQSQFLLDADYISFNGKTFNLTSEDIEIESDHLQIARNGDTSINVWAIWKVTDYSQNPPTDVTATWTTSEKRESFVGVVDRFEDMRTDITPNVDFYVLRDRYYNTTDAEFDRTGYGEPQFTPSDYTSYFDKDTGDVYWYSDTSGSWMWEVNGHRTRIENAGTIWMYGGNVWINYSNLLAEFNILTASFSSESGVFIDTPNLKIDESGEVTINSLNLKNEFKVDSEPIQDPVAPWRNLAPKHMEYDGGYLRVYQEEYGAYDYEESVVATDHMEAKQYVTMSDKRLKENIKEVSEDYEKMFMELNPVSFNYIGSDKDNIGVIAQELEETLCKYKFDMNLIYKCKDNELEDKYTVDYTKFIGLMIHMIQKQEKEIEDLKEKLKGGYHGRLQ